MMIVGLHGIGQTYRGPASLKQIWLTALRDGLHAADWSQAAEVDLDVISYGPLFRRGEVRGAGVPRIAPSDLDEWECDMLVEWWREASRLSATSGGAGPAEAPVIQGPEFVGRVRTPQIVQRALRQLAKSKFFTALGSERVLLFGLRQVRLFLHHQETKRAILKMVHEAISADTRIIIGHSLGSIVAYEALCESPRNVHTLVTVGSPLGIRALVFDALTPRPQGNRGVWPGVRRWVNLADTGDIVALEKSLAPLFGAVDDRMLYNGWHSHDAANYLSSGITGSALAAALAYETTR